MFNESRKFAHFSNIWKCKRPSNIVEFCNSCWKIAKNTPFHIKSPVKNFHGRAKGGASHRAPLNTPLSMPEQTNKAITSVTCSAIFCAIKQDAVDSKTYQALSDQLKRQTQNLRYIRRCQHHVVALS